MTKADRTTKFIILFISVRFNLFASGVAQHGRRGATPSDLNVRVLAAYDLGESNPPMVCEQKRILGKAI